VPPPVRKSLRLSDRWPKPCGYAASRAESLWLSDIGSQLWRLRLGGIAATV